jgi:hypothetical protein
VLEVRLLNRILDMADLLMIIVKLLDTLGHDCLGGVSENSHVGCVCMLHFCPYCAFRARAELLVVLHFGIYWGRIQLHAYIVLNDQWINVTTVEFQQSSMILP